MKPDRLNALTDGVVAIAITIVVLELPVPRDAGWAGVREVLPILSAYLLSFINIGIFWNNHHHVMMTAEHIDGRVMWPNLAMLFFLSLVPFDIRWIDKAHFGALPVAAYGAILLGAGLSYQLIERALVALHGDDGTLAKAIGDDWKGKLSMLGFASGIGLAFVSVWLAIAVYVAVVIAWIIPDPRIEKQVIRDKRGSSRKGAK
ncbi:TMEM175 family protein [Sphingomonas sp. ASV193]|uniref:TMEM175 family protein n=1 Tax=Sphingomonas sp. ASV193 TaxID=3144405 RepID=UPI0032E8DD6C